MPKDVIMVGIPTMGTVRTELENRLSEYAGSSNPSVTVKRIGNVQDHAAARNALVLWHFDPTVYSHLLMIDSDMEPPPNFIQRMLAVRKPVVSGVSHVWRAKSPGSPPEPLQAIWLPRLQTDGSRTYDRAELISSTNGSSVSRETFRPENGPGLAPLPGGGVDIGESQKHSPQSSFGRIPDDLEEVFEQPGLATGAFCLLVEAWVFGMLRLECGLPWFKTEYLDETQEKVTSEDIYFCMNLEKIGINISILPNLVCRHFKIVALSDVAEFGKAMYFKGLEDAKVQTRLSEVTVGD